MHRPYTGHRSIMECILAVPCVRAMICTALQTFRWDDASMQ